MRTQPVPFTHPPHTPRSWPQSNRPPSLASSRFAAADSHTRDVQRRTRTWVVVQELDFALWRKPGTSGRSRAYTCIRGQFSKSGQDKPIVISGFVHFTASNDNNKHFAHHVRDSFLSTSGSPYRRPNTSDGIPPLVRSAFLLLSCSLHRTHSCRFIIESFSSNRGILRITESSKPSCCADNNHTS